MIARHKVPGNICLFPIINAFMKKIYRCKSDNRGNVKEYIIPGFNEGYLSTYVIEPKNCCTTLPGIVFYHGGGFLLRASGSHYQIAKWYAERANCKVVYPATDRRMSSDSMKKYTDSPVWDAYLKSDTIAEIKYASPMEADSLSGFPNTYMEVAEYDCLRDEGIEFAYRLEKEGVSVELHG